MSVVGESFAYSPAGLRLAAGEHDSAAQAARALSAELAAIEIVAADLGTVPEVAAFVAAALAARDSQAARATREHQRRGELVDRVRSVADLGERLLVDTERISQPVTPVVPFGNGASILEHMGGRTPGPGG
jgi:hypothetical protein